MKPANWRECPDRILRELVWEIDEYTVGYHDKIEFCASTEDPNRRTADAMDKLWKNLSDDRFAELCKSALLAIEAERNYVSGFLEGGSQ